MKNSKHTIYGFILLLALAAACFGQTTYTATKVTLPYKQSSLIWISDDGTTGLGSGYSDSAVTQQCFSWQSGAISFISVPGNEDCQAVAGSAGTYLVDVPGPLDQDGNPLVQLAAIRNGQFTLIPAPPGMTYNLGGSVNNHGQIAVTLTCPAPAGSPNATMNCAYLISADGKFTRLSADNMNAGTMGINDGGDVSGWSDSPSDTTGDATHAVIWSHTGKLIDLTNLAPFSISRANGINSKGQVAGDIFSGPTGPFSYYYDGAAKFANIQVPGFSSNAWWINENGDVAGVYYTSTAWGFDYGRVFVYSNGMLTDVTQATPDLPAGLTLWQVQSINNSGQMLAEAGFLTEQNIQYTGGGQWLLTPASGTPAKAASSVSSVVNGASFASGTSSGTWITIQGKSLSTTTRGWTSSDFVDGNLPTSLDGVSVMVNGRPAYPSYISPTQINVLAPEDATTGPVTVQVTKSQVASDSFPVTKKDPMPAFFLVASKYVAATHVNGTSVGAPGVVSGGSFTPAAPGETIQMFGTGFGAAGAAVNGKTIAAPVALASTVTVTIGGKPATVAYAGMTAPGLNQVNVTIPEGLPDGDAEVVATINDVNTPAKVFVTIKN